MLFSALSSGGLESARGKLKKTPVTTVLKHDGRRMVLRRGEDGTETEEMIEESRPEDAVYLKGDRLDAVASKPRLTCDEDCLDASEDSRFSVDDPQLLVHLEEHGYVVVREAASPADCAEAEQLLWQFLADNAGFAREDPKTWTDENFLKVGCIATGIVSKAGIGQSDFLWHCRLLPAVRKAFASIWGTPELLVSFDAANVFRPWRQDELRISRTRGGWYHVDQGKKMPGLHSVQGFLSLLDADASTGGFVVIPQSHKRHDELFEHQHDAGVNYISVPAHHPIMEMRKKLVVCRAGDLVLWDSRCVHCNAPGRLSPASTSEAAAGASQLQRIAAYVCMTPKANATNDVLEQRKDAYRNRVTTSHWPHLFSATRIDRERHPEDAPLFDLDDSSIAERRRLIC